MSLGVCVRFHRLTLTAKCKGRGKGSIAVGMYSCVNSRMGGHMTGGSGACKRRGYMICMSGKRGSRARFPLKRKFNLMFLRKSEILIV